MTHASRRAPLLLGLVLVLSGCGGGGGSGSSGNATNPPPAPPEPPSDPDPAQSQPAVSIVFPWARSSATSSTLVVRGTAADSDGVAGVFVNDLPADLSPGGAGTANLLEASAPAPSQPAAAANPMATEPGDVVEWSVAIPLSEGENEIVVEVEDDAGTRVERVAVAVVDYVEVPLMFDLDAAQQRLAGLSFNLDPDGFHSRLVEHHYATGEQIVYPQNFFAPVGQCLRSGSFYYLVTEPAAYQLRRFDLVGRHDSIVATISRDFLDADPDFAPSPRLSNLECDPGHDYAYLLANHGDFDSRKSRILRIPLTSGTVDVLSQTDSDLPSRWTAAEMALTGDALVTLYDISPAQPLTRVDLATGGRTALTPGLDVGGIDVVPALDEGIVYVTTLEGVDEIDLATFAQRNVSEVALDDPYTFSQPRSAAYDPGLRRIVMADEDLDMLIAVDVDSGVRSELLARSLGDGRRLVAPRRLVVSQDMARVYVADDGAQRFGKLFEIDLASGDRRTIGNIAEQFSGFASGLALDEEARRAYVAFGDTILEIHLDTEVITAIASPATVGNQLQSVSDLVFDAELARLLVADLTAGAIVAVDPATRQQTVISHAPTIGTGPAFDGAVSLTLGADPATLFVANQTGANVMRVDLASGDRALEVTQCLDDTGTNVFGVTGNLQQVAYDARSQRLLIGGDHVYAYDLSESACSVLLPWTNTLAIRPGPRADQLLGTVFGALVTVDVPTGGYVIVSK